ncbi:hypothetical protein HMPREF0880_02928 [Yokenella regensburgei ATCC 43003]|nr:hypothetical protein HMPREF0880_02928 [Yokenella regensburgei ATCC 43003]
MCFCYSIIYFVSTSTCLCSFVVMSDVHFVIGFRITSGQGNFSQNRVLRIFVFVN